METAEERAKLSKGASNDAIYAMARRALESTGRHFPILMDVGCGSGGLREYVRDLCGEYVGCDLVRYGEWPDTNNVRFVETNLDVLPLPLASNSADAVLAVETIEHLENPRALVRELARLTKPGGTVVITTPNVLSLLSVFTLVVKHQYNAFQDSPGQYPSHISPVLEMDLKRMATEAGLENIRTLFTDQGRIPGTAGHWPGFLKGSRFSDNIALVATKR